MSTSEHSDAVILKPGRDKPVRQRHPWIFSGAIRTLPKGVLDGAIVPVCDARGKWLAYGLLNRNSQIQVRLLSWDEDEVFDEEFWRGRLQAAIDLRKQWRLDQYTNAIRLVNAESDFIPGLVVDSYDGHLVMQVGSLGMDNRKREIAALLEELTGCSSITERSEMAVRRKEGMQASIGALTDATPPDLVEIFEYDVRFQVDLLAGQKTGFYTDQRVNRQRVAAYCRDARVLNAFSYTAGFAVHALHMGAEHVVNVDSSYEALELGESNLQLNGFDADSQVTSIAGDVFQVLRDVAAIDPSGEGFDVAIVDPPKFIHNKGNMERGLRGYKEVNMSALRLLKPDSLLATFSCSGLVDANLFQKVIFGAALDTGRDLRILEHMSQAPDHPVSITFPEGSYLCGLICHVL